MWTSKVYNEQDWTKVNELSIRELLAERSKMADIAQNAKCLECPDFLKHVSNRRSVGLTSKVGLKLLTRGFYSTQWSKTST